MNFSTRPIGWKPLSAAVLAAAVGLSGCSSPTSETPDGGSIPSTDVSEMDAAVLTPPPSVGDQSKQMVISVLDPALPAELLVSPARSGGECGVEATSAKTPGLVLDLQRSQLARIEGWALHREAESEANATYFKLASNGETSYFAPVQSVDRPGLGIRLNDPARDNAGFEVTLEMQHVASGDYVVQIAQRVGNEVLLCDTGWTAKVTE